MTNEEMQKEAGALASEAEDRYALGPTNLWDIVRDTTIDLIRQREALRATSTPPAADPRREKRDRIAMFALVGLLASGDVSGRFASDIAGYAVEQADALLLELERHPAPEEKP